MIGLWNLHCVKKSPLLSVTKLSKHMILMDYLLFNTTQSYFYVIYLYTVITYGLLFKMDTYNC